MKFRHYLMLASILTAFCVFAGCDDNGNGEGTPDAANLIDGGDDVDARVEFDAGDDIDAGEEEPEPGEATLLKVFMHSDETKIYFMDMEVISDAGAEDYDIYVSHVDGPTFEMGAHVEGINLGNETGFHDIEEVPETGYEADGENLEDLIIGISYRDGGSGTTGYIMTDNVYALKLDYGEEGVKYAKIQVLQAMGGEVHVLAFLQTDGTRDVWTQE